MGLSLPTIKASTSKDDLGSPGGGTPMLSKTRDVRPECVSSRGQRPAYWCIFLPKNLRKGIILIHKTLGTISIIQPENGGFSCQMNKTNSNFVKVGFIFYCT